MKGSLTFHCPVKPGLFKFGYCGLGTQDSTYDRTKWEVDGRIVVHGKTNFGRGSNLSVGGDLEIGDNFTITGGSTIICKQNIVFGNNVLISWDNLFMDTDFHKILNSEGKIINPKKPIVVGNNVWIGCRNTILKGAVIPNGCVIAAGSVITKKMTEEGCIYGAGGVLLKSDIRWQS